MFDSMDNKILKKGIYTSLPVRFVYNGFSSGAPLNTGICGEFKPSSKIYKIKYTIITSNDDSKYYPLKDFVTITTNITSKFENKHTKVLVNFVKSFKTRMKGYSVSDIGVGIMIYTEDKECKDCDLCIILYDGKKNEELSIKEYETPINK